MSFDPFSAALDAIRVLTSEMIELQRGSQIVRVPATIGTTMFRIDTDERANVIVHSVDFLIKREHYAFAGVLTEPARGDLATRVVHGQRMKHEALQIGGESEWRWADPAHTEYRVHTKLVATA